MSARANHMVGPRFGTKAERIPQLFAEGKSAASICIAVATNPEYVRKVLGTVGPIVDPEIPNKAEAEDSCALLRQAVTAEAAQLGARREVARSGGTVVRTLDVRSLDLCAFAARFPSAPTTFTRDPCSRCGTRGDLGCRHQQPGAPNQLSALLTSEEKVC